jgi:hypothetical protein
MSIQKIFFPLLMLLLSGTVLANDVKPAPPELLALVVKAKLRDPIISWCKGAFVPGKPAGYAIAVSSNKAGGRYLTVDSHGEVTELATFTDLADLQCLTATEARELAKTIAENETTHGGITPRYKSAVVCASLDRSPTTFCWQYSPKAKAFVKIGNWTT